eukprot:GHVS01006559.1.p1 GENE.GHVS01006559.1~~GHVS01006559.1.p1  ORF type:complete len:173 (-),score=9.93 GHVS01006559.1:10-528(-)
MEAQSIKSRNERSSSTFGIHGDASGNRETDPCSVVRERIYINKQKDLRQVTHLIFGQLLLGRGRTALEEAEPTPHGYGRVPQDDLEECLMNRVHVQSTMIAKALFPSRLCPRYSLHTLRDDSATTPSSMFINHCKTRKLEALTRGMNAATRHSESTVMPAEIARTRAQSFAK